MNKLSMKSRTISIHFNKFCDLLSDVGESVNDFRVVLLNPPLIFCKVSEKLELNDWLIGLSTDVFNDTLNELLFLLSLISWILLQLSSFKL